MRVPSLPDLPAGQRVRLAVESLDELTLDLACRHVETLAAAESADAADAADDADTID